MVRLQQRLQHQRHQRPGQRRLAGEDAAQRGGQSGPGGCPSAGSPPPRRAGRRGRSPRSWETVSITTAVERPTRSTRRAASIPPPGMRTSSRHTSGTLTKDGLDRALAVGRLGHHSETSAGQRHPHTQAGGRVIVGRDHRRQPVLGRGAHGSSASTVVPAPGPLVTFRRPPSACAWRRMLCRPKPWGLARR